MTPRLIDLLCQRHRRFVLDTRTWWPAEMDCPDCAYARATLLPHLDLREQLAFHEAGHAVVHLLCGTRIVRATLATGDLAAMESPGGVELDADSYPAKALMAGVASVERWALRSAPPLSDADLVDIASGGRSDFDLAAECGLTVADAGAALREADADVAAHWPAIERVADALLSRGRLDGAGIAALAGIGCAA